MGTKSERTVMYSQLQPWSTAGAPPCMEPTSGPPVPPRVGIAYETTKPHPWRPTMGYEMVEASPLPEEPMTNQLVNPCFTPAGMTTEPLQFPNLVTGFERNPQHAARAALYTRYTPDEWRTNNLSKYAESDSNRQAAERFRNEAVQIMRQTDEKTVDDQTNAGRRLGERITDVTFWRNELRAEWQKLISEIAAMSDTKRNVSKAIQDLESPLHIAQECLYHRETRKNCEKVHDFVEKGLLLEIDNIRTNQEKLRNMYDKVSNQLRDGRAAQYAIEESVIQKEAGLGVDNVCHRLNNFTRGINYYGGIEKYDPTITTSKTWVHATEHGLNRSMSERKKTAQLRSEIESMINDVANSVWNHWAATNNALETNCSQLCEAKNKMQEHLHKIQKEIFLMEKQITLLLKAIQDKSNPLKVAQTRLEARSHRQGIELCKDSAQLQLIQEVINIQDTINFLNRKLQEAEAQHQQLLKARINLESDLARKTNAIFIDREKCMGMRRSFPMTKTIKY